MRLYYAFWVYMALFYSNIYYSMNLIVPYCKSFAGSVLKNVVRWQISWQLPLERCWIPRRTLKLNNYAFRSFGALEIPWRSFTTWLICIDNELSTSFGGRDWVLNFRIWTDASLMEPEEINYECWFSSQRTDGLSSVVVFHLQSWLIPPEHLM